MVESDSNGSVYATSINALLQASQRLGANRDDLMLAAGIDPLWLRQPDNRISVEYLFTLYEAAQLQTNNPDIALYTGRVVYISGLHVQLYMLTICNNFRDYLNLMPSVLKLRGDIGEVKVAREGDCIRLDWYPLMAATSQQRFLSDEIMSASAAIVNSLCVQPIRVVKACFSYAEPKDLSMLRGIFGDDLSFEQPRSCLYFYRETLNHSIVQLEYELSEQFTDPVRKLFGSDDPTDSFLAALRDSVIRLLPMGDVNIDAAASELNVSRRTLQRRLADRDTQFLQVLQEVRSKQAVRYLADKHLSITEISFLLGYADQGSFSSAFKSWQGVSPSEYRQR
ncbi:MAG TPA: AraC family transcriptional regulator [Porticoccus sp.]|nr:AraC family transcriptional regulator [Porticoccus sp.]